MIKIHKTINLNVMVLKLKIKKITITMIRTMTKMMVKMTIKEMLRMKRTRMIKMRMMTNSLKFLNMHLLIKQLLINLHKSMDKLHIIKKVEIIKILRQWII